MEKLKTPTSSFFFLTLPVQRQPEKRRKGKGDKNSSFSCTTPVILIHFIFLV